MLDVRVTINCLTLNWYPSYEHKTCKTLCFLSIAATPNIILS